MSEQEATPTPKPSEPRDYIVLEYVSDSDLWRDHLRVTATSATGAIRAAADNTSGDYVAIPLRSWKPQRVTVATKPTVQMEELS